MLGRFPVPGQKLAEPGDGMIGDAGEHVGEPGQRRLSEVGQLEELAPAMAPARRLGDRPWLAPAIVEIAEPGIGIGLKDTGVSGEMPGGMLASSIARVKEYRGWRVGAGKQPIVRYVCP